MEWQTPQWNEKAAEFYLRDWAWKMEKERFRLTRGCCRILTVEDSPVESMRLDGPHEQAITRPLSHEELVRLQPRFASAGRC